MNETPRSRSRECHQNERRQEFSLNSSEKRSRSPNSRFNYNDRSGHRSNSQSRGFNRRDQDGSHAMNFNQTHRPNKKLPSPDSTSKPPNDKKLQEQSKIFPKPPQSFYYSRTDMQRLLPENSEVETYERETNSNHTKADVNFPKRRQSCYHPSPVQQRLLSDHSKESTSYEPEINSIPTNAAANFPKRRQSCYNASPFQQRLLPDHSEERMFFERDSNLANSDALNHPKFQDFGIRKVKNSTVTSSELQKEQTTGRTELKTSTVEKNSSQRPVIDVRSSSYKIPRIQKDTTTKNISDLSLPSLAILNTKKILEEQPEKLVKNLEKVLGVENFEKIKSLIIQEAVGGKESKETKVEEIRPKQKLQNDIINTEEQNKHKHKKSF